MEIKLKVSDKEFKDSVIREIARQILKGEPGRIVFLRSSPHGETLKEKAEELLKTDKEFHEIIVKKLKKEINNDKNIKSVAKEILKEKMEERDW